MLTELVVFFALATAAVTLVLIAVPRVARAPFWLGLPVCALTLVAAGYLTGLLLGDPAAAAVLPLTGLLLTIGVRLLMRAWSFPAAQLFGCLVAGAVLYIAYAGLITVVDVLGPVGWIASAVLLVLELAAVSLSVSYAFELLDVLGRKGRPYRRPDDSHRPPVALQVPAYNEPLEVVEQTLRSLAELRYPDLVVQVVDNNTKDEKVWRPLEKLCKELGDRFQFMHLADWPGFKAGALNEATRRLSEKYEIIGIVDADYVVQPDFLEDLVGLFSDPKVAFVQSSQHYRDWEDDDYLKGLFYSYRYFFDVSMPSRAQRNAIIFAGTMGLLRRSALEEIGGWNQDCVTEDAEASLRMLGRGYTGIYDQSARGKGLMPLTFDGLKKQRFRWALGGIQMLRMHWRELLPVGPHRLRLSAAQRIHYLLGSVQWFGEVLTLTFTVLLLLTAAFLAVHQRLPIRQLVGAVIAVPLVFLLTGLLRALWGLRETSGTNARTALRALGVWFALSWVVTLACMRGLVRPKAVFLRTPKRKEGGQGTLLQALSASKVESGLAILSAAGAVLMVVSALSPATAVLALLLLYQAAFYASAPWASLAAEGVTLTEFRKIYRESAQTTGERPGQGGGVPAPVRLAAGLVAVAIVGILFFNARPAGPVRQADLPPLGRVAGHQTKPLPATGPVSSPEASPSPSPSALASPHPSPKKSP